MKTNWTTSAVSSTLSSVVTNYTAASPIIRVASASTAVSDVTQFLYFYNFLPIVAWNQSFTLPILVGHSFEGNLTINYGNGETDYLMLPGKNL